MSYQLSTALGLGIRQLAQVLVLAMAVAAALVLAAVAARRTRRRLTHPRPAAVSAGPWAPAVRGVAVLLVGGPARFRGATGDVVVEDGGTLALRARRGGAAARRDVVVRRGETLWASAADLGEPEHFLGSGEAVWLWAGEDAARAASPATPPPARPRG